MVRTNVSRIHVWKHGIYIARNEFNTEIRSIEPFYCKLLSLIVICVFKLVLGLDHNIGVGTVQPVYSILVYGFNGCRYSIFLYFYILSTTVGIGLAELSSV